MTLEQARKLLGWTQSKLAHEAGEPISTISDIETGRNARPAYIVVMRIMGALKKGGLAGVDPQDVFPVEKSVGGRK